MRKFFYNNLKKSHAGVTLIELLVVVAIIGVIATISVIALTDSTDSADDAKRQRDLDNIKSAMNLARIDDEEYPKPATFDGVTATADEQCFVLNETNFPNSGNTASLRKYLEQLPTDPADTGRQKYYISYDLTATPEKYRITTVVDGDVPDDHFGSNAYATAGVAQDVTGTTDACDCLTATNAKAYCVGAGL